MARVLIVEDSPTQALHIQAILEDQGYTVEVAGDGIDALARIERSLPDLVLTDLEMPRMNGLELVGAIRRNYAAIPVILMTARGSEEIAALALRQGAASYVPKAYLEQDILATLERTLTVTKTDRDQLRALECLTHTDAHFLLHNDAALIQPIIAYQDGMLGRLNLCDGTERMRVGIALQEALLNAMYHGNVEVSSELRQEDENAYHEVFKARSHQPPYRDRRINFAFKLTPAAATFSVRDEGPGFDPSVLPDPTDPANLERLGGRGLLLIRTFMDEVYHNGQGNEITLIKRREAARPA